MLTSPTLDLIGRITVVNAALDILVGIAIFTVRSFEIRVLENGQRVRIFKGKELPFHGSKHLETRLWRINMQSLINPPDDIVTLPDHTMADVAYKDSSTSCR